MRTRTKYEYGITTVDMTQGVREYQKMLAIQGDKGWVLCGQEINGQGINLLTFYREKSNEFPTEVEIVVPNAPSN